MKLEISSPNSNFSTIIYRFNEESSSIVVQAPHSLLDGCFSGLDLLQHRNPCFYSSEAILGKLVSSDESTYRFIAAILPINILRELCDVSLEYESLWMFFQVCRCYIPDLVTIKYASDGHNVVALSDGSDFNIELPGCSIWCLWLLAELFEFDTLTHECCVKLIQMILPQYSTTHSSAELVELPISHKLDFSQLQELKNALIAHFLKFGPTLEVPTTTASNFDNNKLQNQHATNSNDDYSIGNSIQSEISFGTTPSHSALHHQHQRHAHPYQQPPQIYSSIQQNNSNIGSKKSALLTQQYNNNRHKSDQHQHDQGQYGTDSDESSTSSLHHHDDTMQPVYEGTNTTANEITSSNIHHHNIVPFQHHAQNSGAVPNATDFSQTDVTTSSSNNSSNRAQQHMDYKRDKRSNNNNEHELASPINVTTNEHLNAFAHSHQHTPTIDEHYDDHHFLPNQQNSTNKNNALFAYYDPERVLSNSKRQQNDNNNSKAYYHNNNSNSNNQFFSASTAFNSSTPTSRFPPEFHTSPPVNNKNTSSTTVNSPNINNNSNSIDAEIGRELAKQRLRESKVKKQLLQTKLQAEKVLIDSRLKALQSTTRHLRASGDKLYSTSSSSSTPRKSATPVQNIRSSAGNNNNSASSLKAAMFTSEIPNQQHLYEHSSNDYHATNINNKSTTPVPPRASSTGKLRPNATSATNIQQHNHAQQFNSNAISEDEYFNHLEYNKEARKRAAQRIKLKQQHDQRRAQSKVEQDEQRKEQERQDRLVKIQMLQSKQLIDPTVKTPKQSKSPDTCMHISTTPTNTKNYESTRDNSNNNNNNASNSRRFDYSTGKHTAQPPTDTDTEDFDLMQAYSVTNVQRNKQTSTFTGSVRPSASGIYTQEALEAVGLGYSPNHIDKSHSQIDHSNASASNNRLTSTIRDADEVSALIAHQLERNVGSNNNNSGSGSGMLYPKFDQSEEFNATELKRFSPARVSRHTHAGPSEQAAIADNTSARLTSNNIVVNAVPTIPHSNNIEVISIKVIRAWDLTDCLGGTNAYVVVDWRTFGKSATQAIANTTSPYFGATLQFRSPLIEINDRNINKYQQQRSLEELVWLQAVPYALPPAATLFRINVFNRNASVSDEYLGGADVDVADVLLQSEHHNTTILSLFSNEQTRAQPAGFVELSAHKWD